jgi:hypothetical protein
MKATRKAGKFFGSSKALDAQRAKFTVKLAPGCFDRLLRSDESLHDKWLYVRENPVQAGLVKNWKDWPYQIGLDQT